jgi:C4-dicarboxylate-specific signal transduction histidine kinase
VPGEQRPLARALRGETVSNVELVLTRRGGSPRTTLGSARQLVAQSGECLGAVAVAQDITERKDSDLELERIHRQLLDASRMAGMAEVASNVLHNVGNVLTSVNVSASLVAECVKDAKVAGLGRAAALLKEREADLGAFLTTDERGRKLPNYLAQLAEQLMGNQKLALKELGSLRDNIDHIKETVAMQQSYAKLCGVSETVVVASLVEDSLRMNAAALARHGVRVVREIGNDVPAISVDKHKILQILVNLIRNAKYACDESDRAEKLVIIRVQKLEDTVRISVIDNGVGIHPDNMVRLFRHGFTTRKTGHGFGLHSGALAAKELGGSLAAYSDGPGSGATFVLSLPCGQAHG